MSLFNDIKIGDTVTLRVCRDNDDWFGDFLGSPYDAPSIREKFNRPQTVLVANKQVLPSGKGELILVVVAPSTKWWVKVGALLVDPEIILKHKLEKRTRFINRIEKRHVKK